MAQHLRILESLWAKEGAGSSGVAAADQLAIRDAGFDGAGVRFIGPDFAGRSLPSCATTAIWQALATRPTSTI